MCIILVANIIGALATQYIRPFIWISPLSIRVADVSSQFFGYQIVLSVHKKVDKNSGAKVDYF